MFDAAGLEIVEKAKIKELIVEYRHRFLMTRELIPREIQTRLRAYISQREMLIITGIRRCGKSTLLKLICEDLFSQLKVSEANILYLNFDDERFIGFNVTDFQQLYELYLEIENPTGRKYLFFDELQQIAGWEKWVNRLYEQEDVKLFITGSNASLLSSEISTSLTGRNRQIVLYPFSFREYLNYKGVVFEGREFYLTERRALFKRLFKEYVRIGGFPEVIKQGDSTLLQQYFKDILYRDVIARHPADNVKEIKELALHLASNTATLQSYNKIKDLIQVRSINTAKSFCERLSDVFLFYFISLFDYSIKRQIYNPSKVYAIDTALIDAISFKFSRDIGHIYENLVFLELMRRGENVYYWKAKSGGEVDFITRRGTLIDQAIQVSLSLNDEVVMKRETSALLKAKEVLKPNHLLVLTEDEETTLTIGTSTVNVKPIWKWLLSQSPNHELINQEPRTNQPRTKN